MAQNTKSLESKDNKIKDYKILTDLIICDMYKVQTF